jgi:hypothetical protein
LLVVAAMLGGFLLAHALSHWGESEPEVYSLVYIPLREPSIFEAKRSLTQGDLEEYQRYLRTQAALVKSSYVARSVTRIPGVADLRMVKRRPKYIELVLDAMHLAPGKANIYEWVMRNLRVDFPNDAGIMRIGMSGGDPRDMIVLVDAVVQAYMDEMVRAEDIRQLDRIMRLKEVSENYEVQLRQRRRAYRDLAENAGTKNKFVLALKQQFAQERLAATCKELISLKSQLRTLNLEVEVQAARMQSLKADSSITDEQIEEKLDRDKTVLSFMADIQAKETQRDKAVSLAAADRGAELLKQENEEIEKLKNAMLAYRQAQRGRVRGELLAKERATLQNRLRTDKERIIVLTQLDKQLMEEIETLGSEIRAAAVNNVDLESSKEEMDKISEVAKKLRSLVENANVESWQPNRIIRVVGKADRAY